MKQIITAALVFVTLISMGSALQVNERLGDTYQVNFVSPDGFLVTVNGPIESPSGDDGYFRDLEMTVEQETGKKLIRIAIAEKTPSDVLGVDYRKKELEMMGYTDFREITIDSRPAIMGMMEGGAAIQADYEMNLGTKSIEVIISAFYLSEQELNQLLDTFYLKEV